MKAERRRELQHNSLARFMEDLPLYFRFHLNKILFGLLIVLAVVFLVRYRTASARQAKQMASSSLRAARDGINQLRSLDLNLRLEAPDIAKNRSMLSSQVSGAIESILRDTADPQDARLRAEALVARGDLNWALANLPELPGASTQPNLQLPQSHKELLQSAQDAYQQVLKQYGDQSLAAATAIFGLAAIAENNGEWDVARAQYAALLQRTDVAPAYKLIAQGRLQILSRLQEPIFTGILTTQPSSMPASAPTTIPATGLAP